MFVVVRKAGLKPMQLHWAPRRGAARGAGWLGRLLIFARYFLRSRIQ